MFKGASLFALAFILIMPQSRHFLVELFNKTGENLNAWAPTSYVALALLLVAPLAAVYVMKTRPEREEPENPMAKYRREEPFDE